MRATRARAPRLAAPPSATLLLLLASVLVLVLVPVPVPAVASLLPPPARQGGAEGGGACPVLLPQPPKPQPQPQPRTQPPTADAAAAARASHRRRVASRVSGGVAAADALSRHLVLFARAGSPPSPSPSPSPSPLHSPSPASTSATPTPAATSGAPSPPSARQGREQDAATPINCTGVLISRDIVLTAASCNINPGDIAYPGATRLPALSSSPASPESATPFTVAAFERHPLYEANAEDNIFYDIAMATLARAVDISVAAPVAVNVNASLPLPGSVVRVVGYGALRSPPQQQKQPESDNNEERRLLQLDLPLVQHDVCAQAYQAQNFTINAETQFCAGYIGEQPGCSPCRGDDGAPVFQYDASDGAVLMGIFTGNLDCGSPVFPSVFVRTSSSHPTFLPSLGVAYTQSTNATIYDGGVTTPNTTDAAPLPSPNIPSRNDTGAGDDPADGDTEDDENGRGVGFLAGVSASSVVAVAVIIIAPVSYCFLFRKRQRDAAAETG